MPEFSVVIPIFNTQETLKRCVDSVLNQTFQEFEILCCYDDSSDNSKAIIEEYCKKDNRVKFIQGRNKGLSGARNDGINTASGKYILFLDSDDCFVRNALERIKKEFERKHCDIIVFGTMFSPHRNVPEWHKRVLITRNKFYKKGTDAIFKEKSARPFVWRNAFTFEFLKKHNLKFDEVLKVGEDQAFQIEAFPWADCGISFIKDKLYIYTWNRRNSLMHIYNKELIFKLKGHIQIVDAVFQYWNRQENSKIDNQSLIKWALAFLPDEQIPELYQNLDYVLDKWIKKQNYQKLPEIYKYRYMVLKRKTHTKKICNLIYYIKINGFFITLRRILKKIMNKRKWFEKSLFLHRKIAKKFGYKLKLEENRLDDTKQVKDTRENSNPPPKIISMQNPIFYSNVFNKISRKNIDIKSLDIAFIVPEPIKGSGGHRNIYRAVKFLRTVGHSLTVYYINSNFDADTVKKQVSDWFYDMTDIPFIHYEGKLGYHDVCVATWWETVYAILDNREKVEFPCYMVQDYEPSFYPMSSSSILCENTYKQGFMHICSGPWCKAFLNKKYNARAEYFQFPVDRKVYNQNKSREKKNKNIIFFAKPEMPRRCYEIGLLSLQEFHKLNPDVEIILFGSNNVGDVPFPATKLGILPTINDLADLYRNADLGIVFSTTNPSLVPYEMMHCGCPVVDMNLEFALSKYGDNENNVFLFDPRPNIMAKQIFDAINNPSLLKAKREAALQWVLHEFPSEDEMGEIVQKIIINEVEGKNIK